MSKKHNIELTNDQYKTLVKLIFYGDWMLHATKVGPEGRDKKAEALREYIFGQKEKFSLSDWFSDLDYGEEIKHEIVLKLVEKAHDYDEDTFWFLLIKKLAERDTIYEMMDKGEDISDIDVIIDRSYKYETRYEKAFEEREIDDLYLNG